ncbi:MAG: gliding motility lipoprotein GldB [Cyclobacteriaceae bacterium]
MLRFIVLLTLIIALIGCNDEDGCISTPDISNVDVDVDFERLELELFELTTLEEVLNFFNDYQAFTNFFIDSYEYPSDTILANRTLKMVSNPYIRDTIYAETLQTFGDLDELKNEFKKSFQLIKYYYPEFEAPKIQTAVTGFYKDLYLSDSLLILGLDHYLGKEGTFQPRDIPQYILDRYEPENLVPMVIYFLSDRFNNVGRKGTLLSDMISFGKAYYFTKQMSPCSSDAMIVGYSEDVMNDVNANREIIWANFIQNELLYETNHEIKVKFIGERPKIPEIGERCPGRIAGWLGYEIVKAYMENSDVTLQELMKETDAVKIFMQSKYKPRNR